MRVKEAAKKFLLRVSRILTVDHALTVLLVLFVLDLFILRPLFVFDPLVQWLINTAIGLIVITGILAVAGVRTMPMLFVTLMLATLLFNGMRLAVPAIILLSYLHALLGLGAIGLLIWLVLGQVLRKGRVTIHRIQGAIVVYLLLGLFWADLYMLVEFDSLGSFAGTGSQSVDSTVPGRFIYYSFATLTTGGYADLAAVSPLARSFVMLESIIGPLYLAVLIARLVSMAVSARQQ